MTFTVDVDFQGNGAWKTYARLEVPANGYVPHVFPSGFGAHWVRVTASGNCRATAQLHYT